MNIKKVTLSLILLITVLMNSVPTFAVKNIDNKTIQNSDLKPEFKILSQQVKTLSLNDIINTEDSSEEGTSKKRVTGKIELEETVSNKSAPDYTKDSGYIKDSGSVRKKAVLANVNSAGPDLVIGSITTSSTQPFSYTENTNFNINVANIGGQSISNVILEVFVDGTRMLIQNFGTFAPGYRGIAQVSINGLCGTRQIECELSGDATETNTSNNSCVGSFRWRDVIDLGAIAPVQEDDPIICGQGFSVLAPIVNYGNLPATNVPVNLELYGSDVGSMTVDVPATSRLVITLEVTFNMCGSGPLGVKVDKNNTINDADRSNNYALKQFDVTPEVIGKYNDATNLKIGLAPSTRDLLDGVGSHLSFSDVKAALTKWNGITNKCRVGYVATVNSESPEDCDVVIQTFPGNASDTKIAGTSRPDGSFDSCLRVMQLSTYYFDSNDFGSAKMKRTLTHEMGHVYGLDHPSCNNKAIMRQSWELQSGLASYNIEPHDINSLKYLYS